MRCAIAGVCVKEGERGGWGGGEVVEEGNFANNAQFSFAKELRKSKPQCLRIRQSLNAAQNITGLKQWFEVWILGVC